MTERYATRPYGRGEEKPTVALISETEVPTDENPHVSNGVANSVKWILHHLQLNDYQAQVLAPSAASAVSHYAGFDVIPSPMRQFRGFNVGTARAKDITQQLRNFRPDIVHLASPFILGRAGGKAARKLGIPVIASYQTDVADYTRRYVGNHIDQRIAGDNKVLKKILADPSEAMMATIAADIHNKANRTLAPSTAAKQRLVSIGVDEATIHILGRGVDTTLFTPERRTSEAVIRQKAAWSQYGERIVVGYVGRLDPEKEVEKLAVIDDPRIQLVVVGGGVDRQKLEKTLRPDTLFTGPLFDDDLANAYASFDLFVHTGASETFGQTLQEAMASGVPVIAPSRGGPLDIVRPGINGFFFEPSDPQELRYLVDAIGFDTKRRTQLGQQALASIAGKTWAKVNDQLLTHYDAVIDEVRSRTNYPLFR